MSTETTRILNEHCEEVIQLQQTLITSEVEKNVIPDSSTLNFNLIQMVFKPGTTIDCGSPCVVYYNKVPLGLLTTELNISTSTISVNLDNTITEI